jgi:hypothetical protein
MSIPILSILNEDFAINYHNQKGNIKMGEFYKIPDILNNFKVSDFFSWYDDKIEKKFRCMPNEQKDEYFNNIDKKSMKKINNVIKLNNYDLNECNYKGKLYFKINEFLKLDSDLTFLEKEAKEFLISKTVDKLKNGDNKKPLFDIISSW